MFDIAWSELFVILIVALIVVGPKDLPRMMRTVGQWAGRARAMAAQFRRSFDDMARQSELEELRSEVTKLKNDALKPMTDADYRSFGIDPSELPPLPALEDVGAAPPTPLPETAATAETLPAPTAAPAAEEDFTAPPEPQATPGAQT